MNLCSCGCNIEVSKVNNIYIVGHNSKLFSKELREKISLSRKEKPSWNKGKKGIIRHSNETKQKMSKSKIGHKPTNFFTIEKLKEKYSLFSKIEEIRYNPNKPEEKEIQVHCKNHNCENSKEKGGWFKPTLIQLQERIRNIEQFGLDHSYFYCSETCKKECPLYNLRSDPYRETKKLYTDEEYQTFRKFVLERDNYICQFCGRSATDVHHEKPQKIEPFFSLDPDYSWSCCEKCHYEKGHKDECSTGSLANKIC
jgi:5-methylcytosine-specific restriction endonuclease McrA